jgi:hypothetical protein
VSSPIVPQEAVARICKRLVADRPQGVVIDTSMLNITPDFSFIAFLRWV